MIGSQVSHYRLTRKLGAGTYGEVYEGVHVHDEELRVAVKVVSPALAREAQFIDALKRQCRHLDRMNHPNIVRFRELVVNDGGVAMVLELLRGQDLHDRLAGGPLPVDTAVPVVEAILEGLGHAHTAGVLHRDIKPRNVYWCDDDRIVILDFGIARAADGTQATKTGHMVGTFDYMAPERMSGSGRTASSDVYAVGLIAWELLAGKPACPEGDHGRKLEWHRDGGVGDATRVASMLPECPHWLAEVVARLAAMDPEQRPADACAALVMLRAERARTGRAGAPRRAPPPQTVVAPAPAADGSQPRHPPSAERPRGAPATVEFHPAGHPQLAPSGAWSSPPGVVPDPAPVMESGRPARNRPKVKLLVVSAIIFVTATWALGRSGNEAQTARIDTPTELPKATSTSATLGVQLRAGETTGASTPSRDTKTSFGYTLTKVPAGTYSIGGLSSEANHKEDGSQRSFILPSAFLMGTTEVTQGQYRTLMGTNPVASNSECIRWGNAAPPADNEPVYCLSWADAAKFANAASAKDGLEPCYSVSDWQVSWPKGMACAGYRLPTEYEWEIAARGGGCGIYAGGNDLASLGWFDDNSHERTHPVGQKAPNGYGIYDMSGNVWEWTWEIDSESHQRSQVPGATGASGHHGNIARGGSSVEPELYARSASRQQILFDSGADVIGFRLSRSVP